MKVLYKEIGGMLTARQKRNFIFITAIMLVSAGAGQLVPLCVGRLTDELLGAQHFSLAGILPFLVFLLAVSVANELLKVARRLMVEDTCTRFEKTARTRAVASLLKAPLSYFRENMTGNIHGMLNRSLEGAVKLLKLLFMDLAPAVFSGAAAVAVLFSQLPPGLALAAVLALGLTACDSLPGDGGHVVKPSTGSSQPFEMHFIDVGQALSVLVECDGQFMLYDGGNVDDGSLVVSYLQKQGVQQLQYVFCSHAHEDHVGGLAAVMAKFPAQHAYSPVTESSTKCFNDFVKYTQQQGLQLEVPSVGTVWPLGSATVTLLGPVTGYSDTNNTSLVLRIDYGNTSFLLTGDMEKTAETDLVNSGANLKADVLQVGHHGSSTSTGYLFLNAVLPEMGVISCGTGNKYGHPHEETLSILRDAKVDVYRTDLQGTITIGSDGQNFTVGTEHFVPDSQLNPTDPSASSTAQQAYIGNVNSKKFHLPTCANLPAEKNQIRFSSYDEAIAAGYTPCASCIK